MTRLTERIEGDGYIHLAEEIEDSSSEARERIETLPVATSSSLGHFGGRVGWANGQLSWANLLAAGGVSVGSRVWGG